MTRPVYLLAAVALSPQDSFKPGPLPEEPARTTDGMLFVRDADYTAYINPVAIRRMSRLLKMTISTGMECLRRAGIAAPDAIITGTGRGSMHDTEHFLNDMIRQEEQALNPTYFIQSTYNSANGWLAMHTKCTGYNQTYVHRGASFELALQDAIMLLEEGEAQHVLTGCFDELTTEYFFVKGKIDYWKKPAPDSLLLLQHSDTPGTIGGEGAAFFMVSGSPDGALARLRQLTILSDPQAEDVPERIRETVRQAGLEMSDLDLVITGMNGDVRQQELYGFLQELPDGTTQAAFKHLTGEYDTSGGFALWLATQLLQQGSVPDYLITRRGSRERLRHILIVNHYILPNMSVLVVSVPE